MGLDQHAEQAKCENQSMNLIQVWWNMDEIQIGLNNDNIHAHAITRNGRSSFILLAIHILSVVPNSAATEQLFSQFGIIHSKLCNHLSVEKVCKQALVRADTITQHGYLRGVKRKFVEVGDDDNELPVAIPLQMAGVQTSCPTSTTTSLPGLAQDSTPAAAPAYPNCNDW
ncbi:hypothetical protein M404DRAFT_36423 [Pisolithus tinctorius Marx 270]|uniref:HAT C-terminal dimerisation domain-containing protein n=1 Tax=Pisolithus tinctorius Marx 270 TaxID=870435 RepID=A0A0C3NBX2_PISTI|nr:hypothetical protein M404DRAFT_36423 [Pisolithus tinctorius Marx 270]